MNKISGQLTSSVKEISWPPLPTPLAAQLFAMLSQLEKTQWLGLEEIQSLQFQQISSVVSHAFRTVPFYREILQKSGFTSETTLSPSNWRHIPILTREDIQAAGSALHSNAIPAQHGKQTSITTSGSTGKPITALATDITGFFWNLFTLRNYLWHLDDFSGKLAAIRTANGRPALYPDGMPLKDWGAPINFISPTGPGMLLDIQTDVADQAEWLVRQDPDHLVTFPSNLKSLLRTIGKSGNALKKLKTVHTLGEVVSQELRNLCTGQWGVPIVDMYSSQEVGYIALQCPEHDHYHIQAENVFFELINDQGQPCKEGEIGKIVLTTLHNFAMPLLRYQIGDYAELGPACPCGRGLPVLKRILGRVRNMLRLPTGEERWPYIGEKAFAGVAPVIQYQIIQQEMTLIEARMVVERPVTSAEEEGIRSILIRELGYPFEIVFSYQQAIPRSTGGKYEDFVSRLNQ